MKGRLTSGLVATLLATGPLGCSGEVGVHVSLSVPEELWPALHGIDHVSVRVTQGSYQAQACLYPLTSVPTALVVASMDPFECADRAQDLTRHDIDSGLAVGSWGFDAGDRSLNFSLPGDGKATFDVSAGLGGAVGVLVESATATPAADFPTLEMALALGPGAPVIDPAKCKIQLSSVDRRSRCSEEQAKSCLFPTGKVLHSNTRGYLPVEGVGCRAYNDEPAKCADPATGRFVATVAIFPMPNITVATARIRGRFARCTDGGDPRQPCRLTTQCTAPRTTLAVTKGAITDSPPPSSPGSLLSCIPPTTTPASFALQLTALPSEFNLAVLAQDPITDPDACFFDVLDLEVDAGPAN